MQPAERIDAIARLAGIYQERRADMAALISAEIGAPITFAKMAQVRLPLTMISAFCGLAGNYEWQQDRPGLYGKDIRIRKQPVGVVGAIVPWNVPFSPSAKLAPALLTGCTVVLKPAEETPLNALVLAEILAEAGLPEGVLSVIPADRTVSEVLVRHPAVDKISFTGTTAAGKKIAAICGEQLKRYSLELGGKSAAIILEDADSDDAAACWPASPTTARSRQPDADRRARGPVRRDRRGLPEATGRSMRSATPWIRAPTSAR